MNDINTLVLSNLIRAEQSLPGNEGVGGRRRRWGEGGRNDPNIVYTYE
jgi:hypothetical protein